MGRPPSVKDRSETVSHTADRKNQGLEQDQRSDSHVWAFNSARGVQCWPSLSSIFLTTIAIVEASMAASLISAVAR